MSDDTHQTEGHGGQQTIAGPGTEREGPQFTNKVTGPVPDAAKLKLKGGTVEWDGDELQRTERVTLIVDCVVSGVGVEDDLDEAGYVKKTWRVQTATVESIRQATEDEHSRIAVGLFRATARPEALGEPGSPAPADDGDELEPPADIAQPADGEPEPEPEPEAEPAAASDGLTHPDVLPADQIAFGDRIVIPGAQDGVVHEVYDVLPELPDQPKIVRVQLDSDEGEILELDADQEVTGHLLPRDEQGNPVGQPEIEADEAAAAEGDADDEDMKWTGEPGDDDA